MFKQNKIPLQAHLEELLSCYPDTEVCWIAYSGGMDSHILLHALAEIREHIKPHIIAIHINHGSNKNADLWQQHCRDICQVYDIEFKYNNIVLSAHQGSESLAREKRYAIFSELVKKNHLLLTAHHANDQIETILFRLLRGAGAEGLSGIPVYRAFSQGYLLRPLLAYSRQGLHDYAIGASLNWIEDDSNQSNQHDRNFLRNKIIPELSSRWPGILKTIPRAAQHQTELKDLIAEIAESDLQSICGDNFSNIYIDKFRQLSAARRKHVLRTWIKKNQWPIPDAQLLDKIDKELIAAGIDRNPCIQWQGAEMRRYRNQLYIMPALVAHDPVSSIRWDLRQTLITASGSLTTVATEGHGINQSLIPDNIVEVKSRQGGETIRPVGQAHTRTLKKLFQQAAVPPWLRNRIPLLFYKDDIIAVADLWINKKYVATGSQLGWKIIWDMTNITDYGGKIQVT